MDENRKPERVRPESEANDSGPTGDAQERSRRLLHDPGVSPLERNLLLQAELEREAQVVELRRELEGMRGLLEITREISSILDHDRLLRAILDNAIVLTGAQRGLLLLAAGDNLTVEIARAPLGSSLDHTAVRFSETLARQSLRENRVIPLDHITGLPELRDVRSIKALDLDSAVCVPLREKGVPTGVLYLDSSSAGLRISPMELGLLEAFASQASIAFLNARLMRDLEESRILLARENEDLRAEARADAGFGAILGQSPAMLALFDRIRLLKDTDIPVLLLGESGTGKELVARALHHEGIRRNGPFVPVNCAGLPGDLLDSLMFGHKRGAFTGAVHDRPGLVEQASGGTLFLDEVSDMPLSLQVKMLRFLENFEFRRVGENEIRRAHTRVISATNRSLTGLLAEKLFREDLYFRLAGVSLEIPPLRERPDDIPMLLDHFLQEAQKNSTRRVTGMSERARRYAARYSWPGNIRQLKHAVEGACAYVPDGEPVDEVHLRMHLLEDDRESPLKAPGNALHDSKARVEQELLCAVLARADWNITRAAHELGISRQHLHNRIRFFELHRPDKK